MVVAARVFLARKGSRMASKRERAYESLVWLEEQARLQCGQMLDIILYHDAGCETRTAVLRHLELIGWSITKLIEVFGESRD
jgi:hypothetical protein